jgi:hypothetical protein
MSNKRSILIVDVKISGVESSPVSTTLDWENIINNSLHLTKDRK